MNKSCTEMCPICKQKGRCDRIKESITSEGLVLRELSYKELFGFDKEKESTKKAKELYNYANRVVHSQFQESSIIVNRMLALKIVDEVLEVVYQNWYDSNNGVFEFWGDVQNEIFKLNDKA